MGQPINKCHFVTWREKENWSPQPQGQSKKMACKLVDYEKGKRHGPHSCEWGFRADWHGSSGFVRTAESAHCAPGAGKRFECGAGFVGFSGSAVASGRVGIRCGGPLGRGERGGALDRGKEAGDPRKPGAGNPAPGCGTGTVRRQAARVGVRVGGWVLRESGGRALRRRKSKWAGISVRGLPPVGGR